MPHNKRIAIFYPTIEGNITTYYDNITDQLLGAIGTKYGTAGPTQNELNAHKNNIPVVIKKAYDDDQVAQGSTEAKDDELHDAKTDMLRELQRITKLDNWDEADGETLGIRVEKTAPDLDTIKPRISGITSMPEKIEIDWVKQGMQGVIIFGSYDGSNFTEIGRDSRSPFEDERKNQTPGQPETRHYKLRYVDENQKPVGVESDVVKAVAQID
ncbi:hypothetical protein LCGC14_1741580 [marine sediment metagenome]|uniref:Uncharacterized protein n=1 Tax=marine sediment metagenome TaxID=412755 RepID=A0A0F9H6I7_9ZZZZ|nr:hypothetical protein [bacterium]